MYSLYSYSPHEHSNNELQPCNDVIKTKTFFNQNMWRTKVQNKTSKKLSIYSSFFTSKGYCNHWHSPSNHNQGCDIDIKEPKCIFFQESDLHWSLCVTIGATLHCKAYRGIYMSTGRGKCYSGEDNRSCFST